MTRYGITKMLHRWGFRYTRPTYTLKRANPRKQQEFQGLKKTSPKTWC
ncbi:winged helix-turn-helix domain-containing protein [Anoxybacillus pushchinoensis]|nr:winged helix-turn-helix domain-containing protein [Anoxybacillus pushchinoensis]